MALDFLRGKEFKEDAERLRQELEGLKASMSSEMRESIGLSDRIRMKNAELAQIDALIAQRHQQIHMLDQTIREKQAQIITFDDEILVQEFGLYQPRYDLVNSSMYKDRITDIRNKQKERLKFINSEVDKTTWTVNGSLAQGKKMVRETQRLLYRAFNSECDELVRKVKYSNIKQSVEAIRKSALAITKLGQTMSIFIDREYARLKEEEAYLQFEYQQKKEEEKEALREAREQEREERAVQKEIEEARKRLLKEQMQYSKALLDLEEQIKVADDSKRAVLEAKREELLATLGEIDKATKEIDYREANHRAGYVYVISNIGSFGENVFKIGMTRRLEPEERVRELSDASVPFDFDKHALIFSDDAPGLEAKLHAAFSDRKLNLINQRREFFQVTLDEIKDVVDKNFDKTVEFIDVPDAEQYRASKKTREMFAMQMRQ